MPKTAQLNAFTFITLDANGNGTASIGPTGSGESWENVTASVRCATNVKEATCQISIGSDATSRYFIDATTWGSTGASTASTPPTIPVNQTVSATWSNGDAGATAYLTVTGTRRVA
jgi:hypothetical protein